MAQDKIGNINKVAVIGAGVMGAQIAAHVANAGVPVVLLDVVPGAAAEAVKKLQKMQPAPLMHKRNAKLITPENLDDGLEDLADCDWIIEAIIEKLDIKQQLYRQIASVIKPGATVSSNTSTMALATLMEGMSEDFCRNFLITHFFNPPRYMQLLEIVKGPNTVPGVKARIMDFADKHLGKSVVECRDSPGFIANRLGVFWLHLAVREAMEQCVTVEEADSLLGRPCGIPKTGVFGLLDLVGLDIMPYVTGSMVKALPKDDPFPQIFCPFPVVEKMIAEGYTGRKGKGGFYRLNRKGGGKVKESIDLKTGDYAISQKSHLLGARLKPKDLRQLVSSDDRGGHYAWRVLSQTLSYAATILPEATDHIYAVDEAMRRGYNWQLGPFELIDILGVDWFIEAFEKHGAVVPPLLKAASGKTFYRTQNGKAEYLTLEGEYQALPRPEGVLQLSDIKAQGEPLLKNGSAALWDLGDGVCCFEMTSKMNTFDPGTFELLGKSITTVQAHHKALILYSDKDNFSVGANLGLALFSVNIALWSEIEKFIDIGQQTFQAMKKAPFPVVAAPAGMALGGGCEIILHADAIQAHAETYTGLVEVGVGVIPGWGGCKEMLGRWFQNKKYPRGPMPAVIKVFETVSVATVSPSAEFARDSLFLRPGDGITMNRARLLADAKARALAMAGNYTPPEEMEFYLPGETARVAMKMAVDSFRKLGKATAHDEVVAAALAEVLSGGEGADASVPMSEADVFALEKRVFLKLLRHPDTIDRIEHMIETGKPLRN